jgi:hypothetical protein
MSTTAQTDPKAPMFTLPLNEIGTKTLEAATAFAEAQQRVVGQIIELGSIAATERLRTIGEMQTAAMEAARAAFPTGTLREGLEELRQDPFAWYRRGVLSAIEGGQRMMKLFETNVQIASKSAERFKGSADRAGREIQDAVSGYSTRMRQIYNGRQA